MDSARAEVCQCLIFRLQCSASGNGHVVIRKQVVHCGGVLLHDRITPPIFQMIDLVPNLVLLRSWQFCAGWT
jgi:hypothetical protein